LWGIVATANFVASTAAHKGRGLQNLFIQMENAVNLAISKRGRIYNEFFSQEKFCNRKAAKKEEIPRADDRAMLEAC
jgi:hypothetical protein